MSSKLNGLGKRACTSWVDAFVEYTANLDAPEVFRRWAAITTLAASLEEKVWLMTSSPVYPNLYTFLVGHPGTGKTRVIRSAKAYLRELPEPHIAPLSLTWASLVDALLRSKRTIIRLPDEPLEYNSMFIAPDELGTFIHKYDNEMTDGLSALYDPDEYSQERRGGDLKIKIKSPQVSILSGATPTRLMEIIPESAWGQGFTSRALMIFSDERIIGDDFAPIERKLSDDLLHDIKLINGLVGNFQVAEDYRNLVNLWRQNGEAPAPTHPKLIHYNTRRKVHFYKLSMVAAIDRSNTLVLTRDDFNRAMNWLVQAEANMPDVFKAGTSGSDAAAMDEIFHYVQVAGARGLPEHKLVHYARQRVPAHSVMRVIEIMSRSGMIKSIGMDKKTGTHWWVASAGTEI